MSGERLITLAEIEAARARIAPYVPPTPIVAMTPTGLRLKAENLTVIGAFKIRGAFNALLSLREEQRAAGVVAHSSGNHAQAVAWAAAALGVKAAILMPDAAPAPKREGVRRAGAEIVSANVGSLERAEMARKLAETRGWARVEPFDMDEIMCGTGTIGLEILEQAPDVRTVFVPVSGGGLLGGLAAAIKQSRPGVRVIGVEPELADDAYQSFRAGEVVTIPAEQAMRTMADGLRVQRLGTRTWPHIREFVDDIVTVSEVEIAAAMRRIAGEARLVAEPSGAVATAGALASTADLRTSVAVVSGGNVDRELLAEILAA